MERNTLDITGASSSKSGTAPKKCQPRSWTGQKTAGQLPERWRNEVVEFDALLNMKF